MSHLCLTIRFLQPYYHGRRDGEEPEWPPSPLRLYQALVAAAAQHWRDENFDELVVPVLRWFEHLPPPNIVATPAEPVATSCRLYVPDNVADKVAKSWSAGREADIAEYRVEKDVRPMRLSDEAVRYFYPVPDLDDHRFEIIASATRSMTHLGWGLDMIVADASNNRENENAFLECERWYPVSDSTANGVPLRAPIEGTLNDLRRKHQAFLARIARDARGNETFNPVPPLTAFRVVGYRRPTDPVPNPNAVFELRNDDGAFFGYPQDRFVHVAGMVRHVAIEAMTKSPPAGVERESWVDSYVAGHAPADAAEHRQFSYLPLPSIRSVHDVPTDPSVRRVMLAAPRGDERFLRHLAVRLDGQQLKPTPETRIANPPLLIRVTRDQVTQRYTRSSNQWASVTPVILPGHDDHKPAKTRRLIEKALRQAGIDLPCEFEWSAFSRFPKSLTAHKYGRDGKPTGYIRPHHLLTQTAVHLTLRFADGVQVPGPLAIGAGRHCGYGLMAAVED